MSKRFYPTLLLSALALLPGPAFADGLVVESAEATDALPTTRTLHIDLAPYVGRPTVKTLTYDLDLVIGRRSRNDLDELPEWAYAVRLLLSEMGGRRLVDNRNALREAAGILETIDNRRDPVLWNPEAIINLRHWPGCSPDSSFQECANPDQYRGLRQPRALYPKQYFRNEDLAAMVDRAVQAWWLHEHGHLEGIAMGATSFVHRCGGEAYGRSTRYCDGNPDTPDIPGSSTRHGPIAFKGPSRFDPARGFYRLGTFATVDYIPGEPTAPDHAVAGDTGDGGLVEADDLWSSPPDGQ